MFVSIYEESIYLRTINFQIYDKPIYLRIINLSSASFWTPFGMKCPYVFVFFFRYISERHFSIWETNGSQNGSRHHLFQLWAVTLLASPCRPRTLLEPLRVASSISYWFSIDLATDVCFRLRDCWRWYRSSLQCARRFAKKCYRLNPSTLPRSTDYENHGGILISYLGSAAWGTSFQHNKYR
jgi:hypothetical protein